MKQADFPRDEYSYSDPNSSCSGDPGLDRCPRSPKDSFVDLLDKTFGQLEDMNVHFSRKRIQKMENALNALETDLDAILDSTIKGRPCP
ncbi:MAG: hypothetical protein LBJ31_04555 [Treponema sp.]|jgi:hypothetical protein|nr:hypothetical protein [Treponema sp.]